MVEWGLFAVFAATTYAQRDTIELTSLAPRSEPAGATLFTELTGEATGIVTENNYADPRMWGDRNSEFVLGGMGTGVAIGDYDNDGRPDLFVMSKTEECRLFRNLGNWRFENVTEAAGLLLSNRTAGGGSLLGGLFGGNEKSDSFAGVEAWKQGATFADVNNDGRLDLYVCRWGVPNWLFINQGDGTFKEEAAARGLAVVDASGIGAFCDYDRDGWLDVYVQTNMLNAATSGDGQRDYLFHNNGDGTFTDVTETAGVYGKNLAHSSTWWDYNSDGWPDLYVANDFAPADHLYRNNGDGTFTDVIHGVLPTMPYSAMGADLGDVNNDGLIDFFVADMAATTHEKDQRGAASSREGSRADSDSAVFAPQSLRNTLYLNTGLGRFQEAGILAGIAATDWTWSVRFEDLDNDGWIDLHVTNGMAREFHNADLRDQILRTESAAMSARIFYAKPRLDEANLAFRNLGGVKFADVSEAWGLNQMGISFGAGFGDFDRDGDLDLIVGNYGEGVTILRNDSREGHRVVVGLRGVESNRFGLGATVRLESASGAQVRVLTSARGYFSASEPVAHFGLGEDERIDRLVVEWPNGRMQAFSDLPVDRYFTITEETDVTALPAMVERPVPVAAFREVSSRYNLGLTAREDGFQGDNRQPLLPLRFDRLGPALAVGDLNGSGREDLVVGGTTVDPARILARTSEDTFAARSLGPLTGHRGLNDGPILFFDADADGDQDLLVTRSSAALPAGDAGYQPRLLLNAGGGELREAPAGVLPALAVSAGAVAAADFDRDGRLDFFVGARLVPGDYPTSPRSFLLHNTVSRFEDVTDSVAPGLALAGLVTSALWSDIDGDGWIDLLVAAEWGPVRVFRNREGRRFEEMTDDWGFAAAGHGWWTSLAAGDFNGDGRMDYVAGNVGLNTAYHASEESPAVLFHGDFRGRGRGARRLIEAYYEDGRLLPRRTGTVLGEVLPTIRRKYRRNDDFAVATLEEIVGEEALAAAERFEATEFRSGVFLSRPEGGFRFEGLPRLAQIAPVQGMAVGDFDGDGRADIYVVQNSYAPIPAVGRFNGGVSQWLRGDGRGGFAVVPPRESGLLVPGDAKALVVLDLNGDARPDFVTTRNNEAMLAFVHQSPLSAGSHPLRVSLDGGGGNRVAIGARLTLALDDGSVQLGEVTAGGGYFSQSSPDVFFTVPAGKSVRELAVRWPDGRETRHVAPASGGQWEVRR